ncbi:replication endonuclease [Candidatus Igneacidithiobacillus taiwanensis]|uniref:replication endonuclease n=1 Tax=Candidatus Igneacidithiobacillus taiwanensis TaxID=1945924 RepID=UPI00289DE9C3|nr:replication endonuclease [Candidatus Igneacidithiobacillus taiwanensis]
MAAAAEALFPELARVLFYQDAAKDVRDVQIKLTENLKKAIIPLVQKRAEDILKVVALGRQPLPEEEKMAAKQAIEDVLIPAKIIAKREPLLNYIDLDSDIDKINKFAEQQAKQIIIAFNKYGNEGMLKVIKETLGVEDLLQLPGVKTKLRETGAPKADWGRVVLAVIYKNATTRGWWARATKKVVNRIREEIWRELVPNHIKAVSSDSLTTSQAVDRRAEEWAKDHVAVREKDGRLMTLPTPKDKAKKEQAERITAAFGLGHAAKELGYTPRFITITCPAHMHMMTTAGGSYKQNPSYDGTTPKQAMEWINTGWSQSRAAFEKAEIEIIWERVVEPHRDGTPHVHMLAFSKEENWEQIEEILRDRFEAGKETGNDRYKRGVAVEVPKAGIFGAVLYINAYLNKISTGSGISKKEHNRYRAWYRQYGIRAYAFSGRKATVWRLCRSMGPIPGASREAQEAAQKGDWWSFFKAANKTGLQPLKEDVIGEELGGYVCTRKRIIGLTDAAGNIITKAKWVLRKIADVEAERAHAKAREDINARVMELEFKEQVKSHLLQLLQKGQGGDPGNPAGGFWELKEGQTPQKTAPPDPRKDPEGWQKWCEEIDPAVGF